MTTTVDSTPGKINLNWYRGDSSSSLLRFTDSDHNPLDLTGLTVNAQARSTLGQTLDLVATIVDAADGTIEIAPPAGGLRADIYQYDLEVDQQGAISTWLRGPLKVERDVTQ